MRRNTYGGLLKWNETEKTATQTRCLNPPSFNAQFVHHFKKKHPDFTLVEAWRD